jgi:hypothetical protein
MDSEHTDKFLHAIQILHVELDALTHSFGMKGEAVNIMLTGVVDYDAFGEPILKAVFSLDVDNEEILAEALEFLKFSYEGGFPLSNEYRDEDEEYESENWWKDLLDDLDSPENLN